MPRAFGQKFMYDDHDSDVVSEVPPVQNTWYEAFDAIDVRLLQCVIRQTNDETAAKDVEIRWTIDGNVYLHAISLTNNTTTWIYRSYAPSAVGTGGLSPDTATRNAGYYIDKRGKSFKVEIRMTGVPGTNQALYCWCVRETLDLT